ncbi:putative bifunctional diguanylate cyclase/phosphodiesterase [Methylophilus sp. 3sh_L]|uniref:putative bifunctional diguanylate cyclase/phosphodiesterase n=1 Tax=Methylophilus sp. 3sh_L TaxID=3377114 RepID=UPI00398F397C
MTSASKDTPQQLIHIASGESPVQWLECRVDSFTNLTGEQRCLLLVHDVSQQHQSAFAYQQEQQRALDYDRFKFALLELILKAQDTEQILVWITREIEALHADTYCAIVLTHDLGQRVQTVIAPSLPPALLQTLRQLKLEAGNGSLATAIATRQRVIVDNVMTHPYWEHHRAAALDASVASGWAEPILNASGEVLGGIALYARQVKLPSAAEQSMLGQVARLVSIVVDRHLSQQSIQTLAYVETVTGLPNRKKMYEVLQAMRSQPSAGEYIGLIYIDLDYFKWINEAHGHSVGNAVLSQVAERLQKIAQPHFIACMGGDEFLILLSGLATQKDKAAQQVWALQRKLAKTLQRPFIVAGQKLPVTASMGLCTFSGLDMEDTDHVKAADIALHKAKQSGRNHACMYEPGMQTEIAAQARLEAELREAIAQQQLEAYYQVQVDHTGRPFGAEVLLRWQHPSRGLISPIEFIAVAESSGLIVEIGQWVLDQACAQISLWQRSQKTRELSLSVNISARQFRQANFTNMVKACLQRHQINPNALRLELTESLLLENVDDAVRIMTELSQLGIQFSLDDFGTGYSSLQYLKKLPLYQLKIDRSFVSDIVTDSHDRTIVRTIIAMAQSMYLGVIAEGVETPEQLELLFNNGCRRYQGYLFGKPMPITAFNAWLQEALV